MRAYEINRYLNSLISNLKVNTVDRVIYGDANRIVNGIAVCWMPYISSILYAKKCGANVMIVHEPTFYTHLDLDGCTPFLGSVETKKAIIDENQMTIIRCHDVWDAVPVTGVPFMWSKFLDLHELYAMAQYLHVYKIPVQSANEFAKNVARRTSSIGQDNIGVYGDLDRQVTKVGIGTGCISNVWNLYEMGADIVITVDDITRSWEVGEWCHDTGFPVIVVNHAVSEIPAMVSLSEHLKRKYPEQHVIYIDQKCSYETINCD